MLSILPGESPPAKPTAAIQRPVAFLSSLLLCLVLPCLNSAASAEETSADQDDRTITLAEGKVTLTAPADWQREEPRNRIVEHEFSVPAVAEENRDGRVTVMGAGGSVEENIVRWEKQFILPPDADQKDFMQKEKRTIAGTPVHVVQFRGTYKDKPGGPFTRSPTTLREDYAMLAAIVETEKLGRYFIKLYGPSQTVLEQRESFDKMLQSLKVGSP